MTEPDDVGRDVTRIPGLLTSRADTPTPAVVVQGRRPACGLRRGRVPATSILHGTRFTVGGTGSSEATSNRLAARPAGRWATCRSFSPICPRPRAILKCWARGIRRLRSAPQPTPPRGLPRCHEFGAEGIGLARPHPCFLGRTGSRWSSFRSSSRTPVGGAGRPSPSCSISLCDSPHLRGAERIPVTIRLLSTPPLHEFPCPPPSWSSPSKQLELSLSPRSRDERARLESTADKSTCSARGERLRSPTPCRMAGRAAFVVAAPALLRPCRCGAYQRPACDVQRRAGLPCRIMLRSRRAGELEMRRARPKGWIADVLKERRS